MTRLPPSPRSHTLLGARRSEKGLTLVEIMVVMAILGTIMAIVAVNVIGQMDDANVQATRLQMKKIEGDLALYAAKKKGKYPTTSDGLEAAAKYFPDSRVPTDAWGNEFQYFSPASNCDKGFELISYGKDGSQGGEDSNADLSSCDQDID
jgi:general secretion pathway protein G